MGRQLAAICLITDDVSRLGRFYEMVLERRAEGDEQYLCFQFDTHQLSIYSSRGMEEMAPGSTAGAGTGRGVLEFEVDDVDAEDARLRALGVEILKPPATYPWGTRSAWFQDPDGNVVDYFAAVGES